MKAYLSKEGFLEVNKNGKRTKRECPFRFDNKTFCGSWCPSFGRDAIILDLIRIGEIIDETNEWVE